MPNNYIDLVVTSPPYDEMRTYDNKSDFRFHEIAQELYRITKQGGVVVWIVTDQVNDHNESGTSFRQALHFQSLGFKLFDTMIYAKGIRAISSVTSYWQQFEYMFILSKITKPKTINHIRDLPRIYQDKRFCKREADGTTIVTKSNFTKEELQKPTKRGNIWKYNTGGGHTTKDKIAYEHPAIMPEELCKDHIISWSNREDIVYDPFSGSGTTAKMAYCTFRNYIGSEINKKYYKLSQKRLKYTNRTDKLENCIADTTGITRI